MKALDCIIIIYPYGAPLQTLCLRNSTIRSSLHFEYNFIGVCPLQFLLPHVQSFSSSFPSVRRIFLFLTHFYIFVLSLLYYLVLRYGISFVMRIQQLHLPECRTNNANAATPCSLMIASRPWSVDLPTVMILAKARVIFKAHPTQTCPLMVVMV